jgi:hypothetical protein
MGLNDVKDMLVLSGLLGLTVLFDLCRVILANEAQDHNRTRLEAQQIKICLLEVTIQDSSGKILGDMIHQLMGCEWAEPFSKIIWHLLEDRRKDILHLDGSNQRRLGKYVLHRLRIEWNARRSKHPRGR